MSRIGSCAVTMKNGIFYAGKIVEKTIEISMDSRHSLPVALKNLAWIWFRNNYGYAKDHLQFLSGAEVYCDVLTDKLTLKSKELGEITLYTSEILSIQFLSNI